MLHMLPPLIHSHHDVPHKIRRVIKRVTVVANVAKYCDRHEERAAAGKGPRVAARHPEQRISKCPQHTKLNDAGDWVDVACAGCREVASSCRGTG